MISKFFPIGAPAKLYHFGYTSFSVIAQRAQSSTHWFYDLEGLVKIIPSEKKIHEYATFMFTL